MLIKESSLQCTDNTGIKTVRILHVKKKKVASLGDFVLIVIKQVRFKKKHIKKKLHWGVVVSTKKSTKRLDGSYIKFSSNRFVTLTESDNILGTRIKGPVGKEISHFAKLYKKYQHIVAFSKTII